MNTEVEHKAIILLSFVHRSIHPSKLAIAHHLEELLIHQTLADGQEEGRVIVLDYAHIKDILLAKDSVLIFV